MKKIIGVLLVINLVAFAYASNVTRKDNAPLEYKFLIYSLSDYSAPVYKTSAAEVIIKLLTVSDNQPVILWEKKLLAMDLPQFPTARKPLERTLNLGITNKNTYIVYTIIYTTQGSVFKTDHAEWIDRSNPLLKIEI